MAEVFRSGIQAIPKGQWEAGSSVGMSRGLLMRRIILPQAIRIIAPALGNFFVSIFKDSALVSVITMRDLMFSGQLLASATYKPLRDLRAGGGDLLPDQLSHRQVRGVGRGADRHHQAACGDRDAGLASAIYKPIISSERNSVSTTALVMSMKNAPTIGTMRKACGAGP